MCPRPQTPLAIPHPCTAWASADHAESLFQHDQQLFHVIPRELWGPRGSKKQDGPLKRDFAQDTLGKNEYHLFKIAKNTPSYPSTESRTLTLSAARILLFYPHRHMFLCPLSDLRMDLTLPSLTPFNILKLLIIF